MSVLQGEAPQLSYNCHKPQIYWRYVQKNLAIINQQNRGQTHIYLWIKSSFAFGFEHIFGASDRMSVAQVLLPLAFCCILAAGV